MYLRIFPADILYIDQMITILDIAVCVYMHFRVFHDANTGMCH